jgi:hypothetical protein
MFVLRLFQPPLGVALGLYAAGHLFVIWHLMGSKENYFTSLQVWCLAAPLVFVGKLLTLVPYLGFAATIYFFVLLAFASIHLHGLSKVKSWVTWMLLLAAFAAFTGLMSLFGEAVRREQGRFGVPGGFGSPGFEAPSVPGESSFPPELQEKLNAPKERPAPKAGEKSRN